MVKSAYADNRRSTERPLTNNVFTLYPFQTPEANIAYAFLILPATFLRLEPWGNNTARARIEVRPVNIRPNTVRRMAERRICSSRAAR